MDSQINKMEYYIKLVRQESSWGKRQSLHNYWTYIQQEMGELFLAFQLADKTNIFEELADVYMMLEFFRQELHDRMSVCYNVSMDKAFQATPLKGVFKLSYQSQKNCVPWHKIKFEIMSKASEYGISGTKLCDIVCSKLELRYPYLLPYQQLTLDGEYWEEEFQWSKQKKYYKMMEFCTCSDPKCKNYHKAYNGSNFMIVSSKSEKSIHIICCECKKRLPVTKTVLFYGSSQDYKVVLRAVIDNMRFENPVAVGKQYHIKPHMLRVFTQKCEEIPDFFDEILQKRYHIESGNIKNIF